ncbi:MAG: c-type cytochrome [Sulfurospirillum sp.]|nr:c-type cytochrome [Sulfurospirillum sp.]
MKRNILVGIATLLIASLMAYTVSQGRAFQGGEAARVIENIAQKSKIFSPKQSEDKAKNNIEAEKLKALKDKAGNIATFKVSDNYKRRCASCHGIDGKGAVGLSLFGQSAEAIYTKVLAYKQGEKQNPIMRSAIAHVSDEDIKELATEISEFKSREDASN